MSNAKLAKLTDARVKNTAPASKDLTLFDGECQGFGLKITPKGKKVFFYQYWSPTARNVRRRVVIAEATGFRRGDNGKPLPVTVAWARLEAEGLRTLVLRQKRDPFQEREDAVRAKDDARIVEQGRIAALRPVREVADEMLADLEAARKSLRTTREYRRLLNKHLLPLRIPSGDSLGNRPMAELEKEDAVAVRRQKALVDRPILANRVQQLGRALVNFAERIGARPIGTANPFGGKRWHDEPETREALTRDEIAALHDALAGEDGGGRGGAVDAIRFLLYSGMRKGEALTLRWDAVDFTTGLVTLGKTKTGRSVRPLAREALAVLSAIPHLSPYVFPSPNDRGAPRTEIKRTWLRVRLSAGITKPLHALRHTFGTVALSEGVPLAAVGAMLGHRDPATTARYAKYEGQKARAAADVAGTALAPIAPQDVTPIHRRGNQRRRSARPGE